MTRFARAKGSKASNERVAEEATSWHEMKQQLLEKKKYQAEKDARNEANQNRLNNYKKFLEEQADKSSKSEWTEFPDNNNTKTKSKVKKNKNNEETKVDETASTVNTDTNNTVTEVSENTSEHAESKNVQKRKKSQQANKSKKFKAENSAQKKTDKPTKKSLEELSEQELQKVEKKKQKKLRQLEKRKKFKAEKSTQQATVDQSNDEVKNDTETNNLNNTPRFKTPKNTPTQKNRKIKDKNNTDFARRKPDKPTRIIVNGKDIDLAYFDGFPIKKEDYERLKTLRKQMISKGLPRSEINNALKLERRKAEKALAREKKKVCFNCRKTGHNLSECPELNNDGQFIETNASGICFKCGSTEHTHFECKVVRGEEFKFAKCFVCNEQGHIARQCPDNARGLYPKGGACKLCGDVTHFKKDCPKMQAEKEKNNYVVETIEDDNIESLEGTNKNSNINRGGVNKPKHIKF